MVPVSFGQIPRDMDTRRLHRAVLLLFSWCLAMAVMADEKAKTIADVAKEWDDMADGWTSGEMGTCVLEFNVLVEELVRSKVPELAGKDILEFGAGHGVLGLALAESGANVTLVDVAPKMVAQAKEKIAAKEMEKSVKAYCCDILVDCPLPPSTLDLIISGSVLTFTPDLPKTLDKLSSLTRPGGLHLHLVFKAAEDAAPRPRGRSTELGYEDGMSPAQLDDELAAAGLTVLERGDLSPPSMEGSMTWIWALSKK